MFGVGVGVDWVGGLMDHISSLVGGIVFPGTGDNREEGMWPCQARLWGLGQVWAVAPPHRVRQ